MTAGDTLGDIETDKATMSFEASDDGVVARILVPAGSQNVSIGVVNTWFLPVFLLFLNPKTCLQI